MYTFYIKVLIQLYCLRHFYISVSMHHKSIIYNKPTRCNSGSIVFIKNYKYALHVSDIQVFILRKSCTCNFMAFLSCIHISRLVDGRICLVLFVGSYDNRYINNARFKKQVQSMTVLLKM